ncbi:hypothetical protein DL764_006559 [Monosporascus ibericus]|uniref:Centrosomin N-terminal motif 1 domain-containing protein n=1 Tax=Monosporascus ibericus TaxID=155417 RepID=A0A4Q4T7V9_9PEZI|nr:hypothetical protein DL764_006559 [Monosporascus ibericus]
MGMDLSASTGDIRDRDMQSSPVKRSSTATGRRPRSHAEDEGADNSSMGLLEMEKTICTLHKQNFDLKLELYHRRQRQNALEEKVERLEAENAEVRAFRDKLAAAAEEKARHDNAIKEAVALIVRLESTVKELCREKGVARQVEDDGSYRHSHDDEYDPHDDSGVALTPKVKGHELFQYTDGVRSLERVPSFLSEQSEQTENLRSVVLGVRSSLAHTRKVSESSVDASHTIAAASPSVSILSESSFASIYGSRNRRNKDSTGTPGLDVTQFSVNSTPLKGKSKQGWANQKNVAANQAARDVSQGGVNLRTHAQSGNRVLDVTSPLQKLERLGKQFPAALDVPRPSTSCSTRGMPTTPPAWSTRPSHVNPRQDKRDTLHRVITNGPTNKELANLHALPPTPDTATSSTLRRHKSSSQESLDAHSELLPQGSFPTVFERPDACAVSNSYRRSPRKTEVPTQRASTTAFTSRKGLPASPDNTDSLSKPDNHGSIDLLPRPRSAGVTRNPHPRCNSCVSDSDSDGGVDAHSEESTFDYWMRESLRPDKGVEAGSARNKGGPSPSPDLFSLPGGTGGLGMEDIFDALRGNGFLGAPVPALKREPVEETITSLQNQQTANFQPQEINQSPPAPSRRSSLHARTSSASPVPPVPGKLKKNPVRRSSITRAVQAKGRSNSIDSAAQMRPTKVQFEQPEIAGPGRRNQYPPLSGQAPRRSLGLNTFFRRPGSETHGNPSSATEATFPTHVSQLPSHLHSQLALRAARRSVPPPPTTPWAFRPPSPLQDGDLQSATPPPILRNRGPPQTQDVGQADPLSTQQKAALAACDEEHTAPTESNNANALSAGAAQNTSRRKWLGLGRMSSLKNRAS